MGAYDPRCALLVVDVQNDFADPDGSLYVSGSERVIARINREVERARTAGALVVYTQDWHPPHTPHFAQDGGVWPVHCVAGTWGAAFHPVLAVIDAPVIRKGAGGADGYSAFSVRDPASGERSATALEAILGERDVERVLIVGLATDYCVKETALAAARLRIPATVIVDAVRAVDLEAGDGARAMEAMRAAGVALE